MLMNTHVIPGLLAISLVVVGLGRRSPRGCRRRRWCGLRNHFGAKADGVSDDTAAIQKALDQAALAGGRVHLPPARYLVKGSLHIPPGVTLQGVMESPVWSDPLKGSIILATGGRDNEDAPALFEMGHSSAVRGLTVFYPEQQTTNIRAYAWTFHLQGHDNTVENVTLINSYNGIRIGPEGNVRHRIRSVYGCVLRRGILVDACSDIGRIENVQFHCHWWSAPDVGGDWKPVHEFMWRNCEAFIFGRTDWEYVNNTFVFPVNIGYRFIKTKAGAANGQFSGIGSDESQVCVKVEEIQPMGLLISTDNSLLCTATCAFLCWWKAPVTARCGWWTARSGGRTANAS